MKIKKELILRQIAGDTILVPVGKTVLENNGMFIMNEVSADIWKMICDGKDKKAILEEMVAMYDADPAVIRADTEEFLNNLANKGIIEL